MTTKKELETMAPSKLAVLCGSFADSPWANHVEADQGRDLKSEWATLQQETEGKIEIWRLKAVSFLAAVLPTTKL